MKKSIFILLAICLTVAACENKVPRDKKIIASNLLKDGTADPALLAGKWECIKFAYTANGNNISDVAALSNCVVNIGKPKGWGDIVVDDPPVGTLPVYFKICCFTYIQSGDNIINYSQEKSTCCEEPVPYTDDEVEVSNALKNAYSFVIRDNELIIHFTGIKNKNLLVLKKVSDATDINMQKFYVFGVDRGQCGYYLHGGNNPCDYGGPYMWAENLPEEYRVYLLRVTITYYRTGACGGHSVINIIKIQKP